MSMPPELSDEELRDLEAQAIQNAPIERARLQQEHDRIVQEMREQLDRERQMRQNKNPESNKKVPVLPLPTAANHSKLKFQALENVATA
ncbi:hypothetical protein HK100_003422 [Physocladia obscura]|uniref:Uncharacterized protein n=1 Tax=Physocladia obscura TaxID=109957 RepID=A0AAD5XD85_9FUNG|nr:hypothetical protein HK100_003422 [Physocladia obscura]